ncbi:MAG: hypothetical protein ACI9GO_000168 [Bacteroidia bacterium]
MKCTNKVPTVLPRDFFMKAFFAFILLIVSNQLFGQRIGELKHYERKHSLDAIQLPCDQFSSEDFEITFPDSIYDSGSIFVKNLKYKGVGGFNYSLKFENNKVQSTVIKTKGNKRLALLLELNAKIAKDQKNKNECYPSSELNLSEGRRATLIINIMP